jgi:cation diffusion facilitator CzcD-associated flavoprotein CzcO
VSSHDVIVIGAGQAGLAVGHFLARQGRSLKILDAGDGAAAAWRGRWDSLRLFTPGPLHPSRGVRSRATRTATRRATRSSSTWTATPATCPSSTARA